MEHTENIAYPIIAALAWLVAGRMLIVQIKTPTPQRAFIIAAIAIPGLSFLVAAPVVYHRVNDLVGVPNFAVLLVYGGVMTYPTAIAAFLGIVVRGREFFLGRRAWTWAAAYVIALAAMVVLFAAADVDLDASGSTGFDKMYATEPSAAWFLVIFQVYFAGGMVVTAPYWWRLAKQTDERWFRRGMPFIAVGSLLLLGYALPKLAYVALRQGGVDADIINALAPLAAAVSALLNVIGFSLCGLGFVSQYARRWQAYQALHPLWQALVEPFPQVVLPNLTGPANPKWAIWPRRLKILLYRRIMEIRDVRLQLRPFFDPATAAAARAAAETVESDAMMADAAVEAALLRAALAAHAAGSAPQNPAVSDEFDVALRWNTDGTQTAEAIWWTAVADRFLTPGAAPATPAATVVR